MTERPTIPSRCECPNMDAYDKALDAYVEALIEWKIEQWQAKRPWLRYPLQQPRCANPPCPRCKRVHNRDMPCWHRTGR